MGKFGIGARVRDRNGDLAEVIGKRKGERLIHLDEPYDFEYWAKKADLTAVEVAPAAAEPSFEVGQRVVMIREVDGEISDVVANIVEDDGTDYNPLKLEFEADAGFGWGTRNWWVSSSDIAPFTLEAGKFYRTRDGQKVGLMGGRSGFFHAPGLGMSHYAYNGVSAFRGELPADEGRSHLDIVAEWSEPAASAVAAAETIVVEDATDPLWVPAVGDKIRRTKKPYVFVPIGFESTIKLLPSGILGYVDVEGDSLQFDADSWELVATAKPQPKFKVGDRVGDLSPNGEATIQVVDGDRFQVKWDGDDVVGDYWWRLDQWGHHTPATALYIGKAVTAEGYISGANGDNFSVVFANSNRSYDLPATALRAAA